MGLISRLLGKKEEAPVEPAVEKTEEVAVATTQEAAVPEETTNKIVDLPEGKVNRVTVPYVPAPKPSQVYNPDSNEKAPGEKSFL